MNHKDDIDISEHRKADGPSLVEDQLKWTIFMSTVNLPAVLNDPRLSRRETDFFTKTWGENFEKSVGASSHLPNITRDDFKRYLRKTSGVSIPIAIANDNKPESQEKLSVNLFIFFFRRYLHWL